MKLHFHPVSTTSRPVVLFCMQENIPFDPVIVDLMTGEHVKEPFLSLNPSGQVPVLDDDGFVLTESSSILKYLADKHSSPSYPKDLKTRARVNERMDWFNTNHYREWGYHLIYPQVYGHHKRSPEQVQQGTLEWGRDKSEQWLKVLDTKVLGSQKYVCGDSLTIADYLGSEFLSAGDLIGVNFGRFPNIDRWMKTMRALPGWAKTNEANDGFAASLKGKSFVTIS